ncbi:LIM and senescent cell antigen-like-containing domain protein 1 isoform X1 [Gambusia affinis]|uniref:LIM and senescent cell antigen-like-containing domain protein 1 isoform X1 n=1 Tax=Gambusia affinis TaxID=33528 RepID=UPI001CDC1BDB|nr:LIM and senescent cell antigen-like-containing domain protein 1 isoform X1 [Gambusia affinis]
MNKQEVLKVDSLKQTLFRYFGQNESALCTKCEKPFLGHRHYERKGLAYCETHYNQLFGDVCYHCNRVIEGDVVSALNKAWCVSCFSCSTCNTKLTLNMGEQA